MVTIRDILLTPYEIDVESRNFILIKVGRYSEGKHEGEKKRIVAGYYHTLNACISSILDELVRNRVAGRKDLDGQVVNLETFIQQQKMEVELIRKWMKHLNIEFEPTTDLPPIIPGDIFVEEGTEEVAKLLTKGKSKK